MLASDSVSGQGPVLVTSPLDHFIGSSIGGVSATVLCLPFARGLTSTVTSLPVNFSHSFIFHAGTGITATMYSWGRLLTSLANTSKIADPTLTGLSYQTDNGAQYCFCNENCDSKLLQVAASLKELNVPVQLMSFQGGWWTNPNIHTPNCAPWCVSSWVANKTKVPMGLGAFHEKLGLPLQLYAPYFCNDTIYDIANDHPEGKWPFLSSDTSLPGCKGYTFKNAAPHAAGSLHLREEGRKNGMVAFEPDFMQQNYQCVPEYLKNLDGMPTWFTGLCTAAMAMDPPVPVQFCMATPMQLLHSMSMPVVTNFRASNGVFCSTVLGVCYTVLIWLCSDFFYR